jgi:hypothetical protein
LLKAAKSAILGPKPPKSGECRVNQPADPGDNGIAGDVLSGRPLGLGLLALGN